MIGYGLLGVFALGLAGIIRVSNKIAVLRSEMKFFSKNALPVTEEKTKDWISTTIELNILLVITAVVLGTLFLFAYEGAI